MGWVWGAQVVMEYNFHWAGKQRMEMLMQPLPPTWGKFGHTLATWASSLLRCKVCPPPFPFWPEHADECRGPASMMIQRYMLL